MSQYVKSLLFLCMLLVPALTSAEDADAQHKRIDAIHHDHSLSEAERRDALLAAYPADKYMSRESLHRMPENELRTRFRTVDGVMYITADPRYLRDMYAIADELRIRGVMSVEEDQGIYRSLVQLRRFSEARTFAEGKKGSFEAIPSVRNVNDEPLHPMRYFALADDGTSMDLKSVTLNADYTVIVVSHPLCHFSRRASRQIPDQPDLVTLLDGHSLWLEPPGQELDVHPTLEWQKEAPGMPIGMMYATSDWPMFRSFATPSFYVFKGKLLVGMKTGWGGPEDGVELKTLIEKAATR